MTRGRILSLGEELTNQTEHHRQVERDKAKAFVKEMYSNPLEWSNGTTWTIIDTHPPNSQVLCSACKSADEAWIAARLDILEPYMKFLREKCPNYFLMWVYTNFPDGTHASDDGWQLIENNTVEPWNYLVKAGKSPESIIVEAARKLGYKE